jgi:hypothetical protein
LNERLEGCQNGDFVNELYTDDVVHRWRAAMRWGVGPIESSNESGWNGILRLC